MPFPIVAALGLGTSALSAFELIKNLARTGEQPDPDAVRKAIEDKAMVLSRQNGIPMEQAVAAVTEETTKEAEANAGFDPTAAAIQALMLAPGVGLAVKGAQVAKAAGTGLKAGLEAVAANQGGLKGALTGGALVPNMTTARQLKAANPNLGKRTDVRGMGDKTDVRGMGETSSIAGMGAATDLRGVGATSDVRGMGAATDLREVGASSPLTRYRGTPGERTVVNASDERGFILDDGVDYPLSANVFRADAPRIGMGQQNFKTIDVPYEVISPPYNPTRGLPLDLAQFADEQFRRQLMARQLAMREADAAGDFPGYAAY